MEMQSTLNWEFHFMPNTERRARWDDEKYKVTITYNFVMSEWQKPSWITPKYDHFAYDEYIHNSLTCIIFEPKGHEKDEKFKQKLTPELQQEYDLLIHNIETGVHFGTKCIFKEEMARLHEIHRGRFAYLLLPTVGERYTPVFIDAEGIWYRFDVFPLSDQLPHYKPSIYKLNDLWFKNDSKYAEVQSEYWLLGRDPCTAKTQGLSTKITVSGNFLEIEMMVMYHDQYGIGNTIMQSDIRAIHMHHLTENRWHE